MIKQGENIAFTGHFLDASDQKITDLSTFEFRVVIISHELGGPVYMWATRDGGIEKDQEGNFAYILTGDVTVKMIPGWYGLEISLVDDTGTVIGDVKKAFRLYPSTRLPDDLSTGPILDVNCTCNGS